MPHSHRQTGDDLGGLSDGRSQGITWARPFASPRWALRGDRSATKVTSAHQDLLTKPAGPAPGDDLARDGGAEPAEPLDTTRTGWRDRRLALAAGYVALVAAAAWLYGVIPFTGRGFPLATLGSVTSWVECLGDGHNPCPYVGYPQGVDLSLGAALVHVTYQLTRLGLSVEAALNVVALVALATGIAALWALVSSITRNAAAGALAAALYHLSPIVLTHTNKAPLWLGFVLLPVPVALAYAAVTRGRDRWPWALASAGLTFVAALAVVYLDPYAWAIAGTIAGLVCVAAAVMTRRTRWRGWVVPLVVLVALGAPGLIFRTMEPSAELSAGFPPEFYRAYGADLATTVIPTQDSLLGNLLQVPVERWDPAEFYGDGSPLVGAFMGPIAAVAALAGIVWLLRRGGPHRPLTAALAAGGTACLVLGLGPSLKLLDRASTAVLADGRATGPRHLMPASEATLSFPWWRIYEIQPFEGMRAAYRWHVGLRLVLAVLATAAVVWLFRRRRVLGVLLVALLVLETGSHTLLDTREQASRNHELAQTFEDDMEQAFGDGRLRPSERVLFLPTTNDYLIGFIAPRFQVFAYNISFDKEILRLRSAQPQAVVNASGAYWNNTLDRNLVCELFRQDLVDAIVFNDFDMRWDTLEWPPPQQRIEAHRAKSVGLGLFDDPAFRVDEGHLSVILREAPAAPAGC